MKLWKYEVKYIVFIKNNINQYNDIYGINGVNFIGWNEKEREKLLCIQLISKTFTMKKFGVGEI